MHSRQVRAGPGSLASISCMHMLASARAWLRSIIDQGPWVRPAAVIAYHGDSLIGESHCSIGACREAVEPACGQSQQGIQLVGLIVWQACSHKEWNRVCNDDDRCRYDAPAAKCAHRAQA
jgi:hypothetical protein